jgi:hypothetical protein
MLPRGMNPLLVAKILGHESLAMIIRTYSHLTKPPLADAGAGLKPLSPVVGMASQ